MFIYYHYLADEEDAQYFNTRQSYIGVYSGHGEPMPWYRPSECLWMVPGTVDPNEE